jgi:hypothetical protein
MRELLKSVGQLLVGVGAVTAAVTYLLKFRSQNVSTNFEIRALLLILSAELDSQERVLRRLQETPERLRDMSGESLETSVWDENTERIARSLSTQDFRMLLDHFANIAHVQDLLPRTTTADDEDDDLHWSIQTCVERLPFLQYHINSRILSLKASQESGK